MEELFKVAAPTGIAETLLVRALGVLMEGQPNLGVGVRDGTTKEILGFLQKGEVEVAFQGKNFDGKAGVRCIKVPHEEENVLVVPTGHYLALKDVLTEELLREAVEAYPFVGRFEGAAVQEWSHEYLTKRNLKAKPSGFYVKSLEGSMRAVAAGIGMCIVPKGTAEDICAKQIKAISLPGTDTKRLFYFAWRSGEPLSDAARELARILGVTQLL